MTSSIGDRADTDDVRHLLEFPFGSPGLTIPSGVRASARHLPLRRRRAGSHGAAGGAASAHRALAITQAGCRSRGRHVAAVGPRPCTAHVVRAAYSVCAALTSPVCYITTEM